MAYFRKYSKQNAAFGIFWLGVISEGLEIRGTNPSKLPVFIINAEYENPLLDLYGIEFAHRLAVARRHAPRYMRLPRHNHISIVAHFNSGEETVGREILDFFEQLR